MSEQNTEARALAAAESLAEQGIAVTARAVREEAQVSMAVATKAAKTWLQAQESANVIPPAPAALTSRVEAIWRDAYTAAQTHFHSDRAGLEARLAQQTAEANALTEEINRLESELAAANAKTSEIEQALAAVQGEAANHQTELRTADTRAHEAETRAAAAEATAITLQSTLDKALAAFQAPK